MTSSSDGSKPAAPPRRVFAFNGGFFTQRRVRRIMAAAGHPVRFGLPRAEDAVAVWGNSPTAHRGEAIAARRGAALMRVEDAFLRSVHPGRAGAPPLGLLIDHSGVHFDQRVPSDLEKLLASHPLDDAQLLQRARDGMARLKELSLSKYNAFLPDAQVPDPGYVLVVDQTRGDASVTASKGNRALFQEMLVFAQEEHPGAQVLIKTHPETAAGHRAGYYTEADASARVALFSAPVCPHALLEGAVGVYTLSSQFGLEAIMAGHKPRVFGQPFYAGWGLTADETPVPRRERRLTRAQLFAAAYILAPTWYDPFRAEVCDFETAVDILHAEVRRWREDHQGWTASGMRLWKRRPLQKVFGQDRAMRFDDTARAQEKAREDGRRHMTWASKPAAPGSIRVEDGFLRSRGLGAELVPPLSLVADDLGIYYDPSQPSRLEDWIARRAKLRPDQDRRSERLRRSIVDGGLSKYNLTRSTPNLPEGRHILVPGQVENDASILTGAGAVCTNLGLLQAARAAHPHAVILYKPHPDVEAGLRPGAIPMDQAQGLADLVLDHADPIALLDEVDEVWTMTSLLGFEALLRDVAVVTLGAPFYAGWGLTRDLGETPERRTAEVSLNGLIHATLIDYPRYFDPVTGKACPPEVVVSRLIHGPLPRAGAGLRLLSKVQGKAASYAHLWR
ncbi:capsular polysaccharide biosynthesis protein [Pseudaestuariivita sp.]|uniref:capsular polysaccharide biosynthesis protein n=1 Tax=Pseudaestuariivita sp. TaxID=2211669 RepID=UPI004059F4D1